MLRGVRRRSRHSNSLAPHSEAAAFPRFEAAYRQNEHSVHVRMAAGQWVGGRRSAAGSHVHAAWRTGNIAAFTAAGAAALAAVGSQTRPCGQARETVCAGAARSWRVSTIWVVRASHGETKSKTCAEPPCTSSDVGKVL